MNEICCSHTLSLFGFVLRYQFFMYSKAIYLMGCIRIYNLLGECFIFLMNWNFYHYVMILCVPLMRLSCVSSDYFAVTFFILFFFWISKYIWLRFISYKQYVAGYWFYIECNSPDLLIDKVSFTCIVICNISECVNIEKSPRYIVFF